MQIRTSQSRTLFMKFAHQFVILVLLMAALAVSGFGQRNPLASDELKLLRNTTEPDKHLRLYMQFIRERISKARQAHAENDPTAGRTNKINNALEDATLLVYQMDDSLDHFQAQKVDIRKSLIEVMALDSELQVRLNSLLEPGLADPDEGNPVYEGAIEKAAATVKNSLQHARALKEKQEGMFKAKAEASKDKQH